MDSSRRAVESYWRSRMIDAATSDEDKVTPVYKLEEICDLLRSSHLTIVKELSSFILKRLDHKSPIVKQKALRLIKYSVGKSGVEFRREMQRQSAIVRQLFHYKGQLDPLKGDALNKAVRDTAHEVITAMFSEENKPQTSQPLEDRNKRIQGFGNTNSDDKKSFISEVVGIGSASIKQGFSNFAQSKNDNGSYKSPNLHKSLTKETYETESISKGGSWNEDSVSEMTNSYSQKTPEERLLESIVSLGGVRLQPTRDAIQVFIDQSVKLNMLSLSHAIQLKLEDPHWQVRMKAVCVLESILRRKDNEPFSAVASYFDENKDEIVKCSESPQSSLREKATKVLSLLGGGSDASSSEKMAKAEPVVLDMPDLIDTGYSGNSEETHNDHQRIVDLTSAPPPLIDDLFGELKNDDDPFADVSFHTNESRDDLFTGMTVDASDSYASNSPELFDIFVSNTGIPTDQETNEKKVDDLMVGLSINENSSKEEQKETSSRVPIPSIELVSDSNRHPSYQGSIDALSGIVGPQTSGTNPNFMFPQGVMPYNIPPGLMFNQAFASQQINYGAMGNLFAQQLATMSNFQHSGMIHATSTGSTPAYSEALPDIFQQNFPASVPNPTLNSSKKEETKAFDFISDHIAAARDPKRLV